MSHYIKGKLQIKCSIDVMRKALENVMKTWKGHIYSDPNGKIPVWGYNGEIYKEHNEQTKNEEVAGFHIIVPSPKNQGTYRGKAAPDNRWGDVGLRMKPDGTWEVIADWGGTNISGPEVLEKQLQSEIITMKAKAWAALRGGSVSEKETDENIETEIIIDSSAAANIRSQMQA